MAIPLLIDTDPGIDDALALLLAFASPEVSVEAITTVAGNVPVERCTANVCRVLEVLKLSRQPLVAQGASKPLVRSLVSAGHVHGEDGLGDLHRFSDADGSPRYPPVEPRLAPGDGPDLILECAARFDGELVVVALGPLTNLALALQRDSRRLASIRRLVVMGGAVACPGNVTPVAEFNFYVDPEAAARVLQAGLPLELIPLDVTRQTVLSRSALDGSLAACPGPIAQFVSDFTLKGFAFGADSGEGGLTLHDPLALAVALDPSLVSSEALHVAVECGGSLTRGMAVADRRPLPAQHKRPPNCRVAMSVDACRFLALFLDRLCRASR
ncbi:MAG: nucleoside hydrolase [Candidatus Rokubacteria bacterium]|nr:nucleoside hydrolase [Candidatus Rokubacteria bacterium]